MAEKQPLLSLNDSNSSNNAHLFENPVVALFRRYKKQLVLLFWVIANIVTNVWQGVALKQAGNAMPDFPFFIFWFTAIFFVIAYFLFLWALQLFTKQITHESKQFPQYKLFFMGALTTLNGVFILYGNSHVPGVLQALLGPSITTIPITMMVSFFMLRTKYRWQQIVSVFVILSGIFVAILPSIIGGNSQGNGTLFWDSMFVLSSIPICLSSVYQEKAFSDAPIHVAYMIAWSTLYQCITIFMSAPLAAIPGFGTSTFKDLIPHEIAGVKCFLGYEIDPSFCPDGCTCQNAWIPLTSFILAYIFSSLASVCLVKYGNATFSYVASTIGTPVTAFAFSWRWVMGDYAEALSKYNYISIVLLLGGIVIFRFFDKQTVVGLATITLPKEQIIEANEELRSTAIPSYTTAQSRLFTTRTITSPAKDKAFWTVP
eukprot:TRINITY_DN529_c0_g1_i1.p1 TRINITY_DN529_c0_g1~~TRINITY_DN529_c0_g1_i1.p1  ORF type:complete len:429 (+),score=46.68 TRINITY_DN529_c0_g1_i1:148-1434(+)